SDEHSPIDRNSSVSRHSPPPESSGARAADAHQRANPEGSAARRSGGEEEDRRQEGLIRSTAGCCRFWSSRTFRASNDWSETWQKNQRPQEQRRIPERRGNRQRQPSARKNLRRSASVASFRTVTCISPRHLTTHRSPSRTPMAA